MKTLLSVLILLATLFSCSEQKATVKTMHLVEYSAHKKDGKIMKGDINHSYSIGRYENGSQKYFVGLLGYEDTDTTWFDRKEQPTKKEIDNKTFHYRNDQLLFVEKKVKDTIFYYDNDRLDSPDSYVIKKGNKIIEEGDYFLNTKETTIEQRNNKQGDIIYLVVESAYLPSEFDKKRLSEMEIAKEQVERYKMKIFEYEYEYY